MWGRLHTATFREGTLGESGIGPLEWYFNHGPVDVGGAAGAADNTSYRISRAYPDPTDPAFVPQGLETLFTITNLPSYRLVIDMSDLDGARIVITTGQSGNPFDGHYSDLVDPWRTGGTVPLPFTRAAIEAATVATLTLSPAEAAP
jgi:penicillin amidase